MVYRPACRVAVNLRAIAGAPWVACSQRPWFCLGFVLQLLNVVRSTPPDKIIEVYVGDSPLQWITWSRQPGVSLMGDAAHSMLPTLGRSPECELFGKFAFSPSRSTRQLEQSYFCWSGIVGLERLDAAATILCTLVVAPQSILDPVSNRQGETRGLEAVTKPLPTLALPGSLCRAIGSRYNLI